MVTVRRLPEFDKWIAGLRDPATQKRLLVRLRKAQLGHFGDVKALGGGVYEMREFFGPGWRMYYAKRGDVLIVMLGGRDKSTQSADIETALNRAKHLVE
jgi:putative addiction module killer protein